MKETDAFTGGSDAVDYNMGMVELDAESKSRANAPGMGEVEGGVKWSLVNGGEENSSRAFDDSLLANSTTEIYLGENIKKLATPEAMSRVEGNNDNLSSTVSTLLRLSRPFSFCWMYAGIVMLECWSGVLFYKTYPCFSSTVLSLSFAFFSTAAFFFFFFIFKKLEDSIILPRLKSLWPRRYSSVRLGGSVPV